MPLEVHPDINQTKATAQKNMWSASKPRRQQQQECTSATIILSKDCTLPLNGITLQKAPWIMAPILQQPYKQVHNGRILYDVRCCFFGFSWLKRKMDTNHKRSSPYRGHMMMPFSCIVGHQNAHSLSEKHSFLCAADLLPYEKLQHLPLKKVSPLSKDTRNNTQWQGLTEPKIDFFCHLSVFQQVLNLRRSFIVNCCHKNHLPVELIFQ